MAALTKNLVLPELHLFKMARIEKLVTGWFTWTEKVPTASDLTEPQLHSFVALADLLGEMFLLVGCSSGKRSAGPGIVTGFFHVGATKRLHDSSIPVNYWLELTESMNAKEATRSFRTL